MMAHVLNSSRSTLLIGSCRVSRSLIFIPLQFGGTGFQNGNENLDAADTRGARKEACHSD